MHPLIQRLGRRLVAVVVVVVSIGGTNFTLLGHLSASLLQSAKAARLLTIV